MRLVIVNETFFTYVVDEETGLIVQTFLSTIPDSVAQEWIDNNQDKLAKCPTPILNPLCVALPPILPQ